MKMTPSIEIIDLYRSGAEGYHTYRIPSLVTTGASTVLSFCEGRRNSAADDGDIDLLLRRSEDSGISWSACRVIATGGGETMGNPCPVVDLRNGDVLLLWCRNNRRILCARSADDGLSWSEPVDITPRVADTPFPWVGTGPGHGIALHNGRLLIPCWADNTPRSGEIQYSFAIISDDGGASWQCGQPLTMDASDECEAVELLDGSVYLTLRSRGQDCRGWAISTDGGERWSPVAYDSALPEPSCQGSIIRLSGAPAPRILQVFPANAAARDHLTLFISEDEGRSWPSAHLIYAGQAAYSDLTVVNGTVLCLFEADDYQRLALTRIHL